MKLRTGFLSYNPAQLLELTDKAVLNATGAPVWPARASMLTSITASPMPWAT